MKKILIVLDSLNLGGAERQAINLAAELIKVGYHLQVIGLGVSGNAVPLLEELKIDFRNLDLELYTHHPTILKRNRKSLRGFLKKQSVDVIIPFTYWPNLYCNWTYKKAKVTKCFWNQRDLNLNLGNFDKEQEILQSATTVIGNSKACLESLEAFFDVNIDNKLVIRNGISSKFLIPRIKTAETKDAIMVANIQKNKDHQTLFEAWKIVKEKLGSECPELHLAGAKRDTFESLELLVERLDIKDKVKFLGMVDDIPELLKKYRFSVFSSNAEGSPNGVLECMANGLPIVATKISSIEEATGSAYDFLVPIKSPQIFTDKIIALLSDPGSMDQIGLQNQERIKSDYSVDQMVESYIKLIEE